MNSSVIEYRGEVFTKTTYNDISVIIDSDGYYNASRICSDNDTRYRDIAKQQYWSDYINELTRGGYFSPARITKVYSDKDGYSNDVKGTYIHPKLVNFLCIHVNFKYAITVGEIMDLINEKIHQENSTLHAEIESLKQELKTVKDDYDRDLRSRELKLCMLNEENTILHENTKNLTNNVNELKTRTVPKKTNNKVLRILIDSEGDMKISANSHWSDRDFERNGFRVVRHYSFPASMNVRQLLRDCKYVSNLYFNPIHLDSIYEIIDSEHPLDEW